MIETYILLNRQPKIISKLFLFNIFILITLIIYASFTFRYTSYFYSTSKITFKNNIYLLKITTSINNLDVVAKNKNIIINNKEYMYEIYEIESTDKDQEIYLKVFNLEEYYLIDNYSVNIKIERNSKVLIDYLKWRRNIGNERIKS